MEKPDNFDDNLAELDAKRIEVARCYQMIQDLIDAYDEAAKSATKRDHLLGIQNIDVEYLWNEIRKLQKGNSHLRTENEALQKLVNEQDSYCEILKSRLFVPGFDPSGMPPRPVDSRLNAQNRKDESSDLPQSQSIKVEKQFYCGLDTPESGMTWDNGEMIHLGGWCCDAEGRTPKRVWVAVGSKSVPCLTGWKRSDVVEAFKGTLKVAGDCGFNVEIAAADGVNLIRVWAEFASGAKHCLFHRTIVKMGDGSRKVGQLNQHYDLWVDMYDTVTSEDEAEMLQEVNSMECPPLISVLLPTYNTEARLLTEAIESVRKQIYPHWELCVADDASPSPHVREILEYYHRIDSRIKPIIRESNGHISAATNSALENATGEFCALLDHDDVIPSHALFHVAKCILENPEVNLIFSDEDKIDEEGVRFDPYFKSDWNPELFLSHNCISHLGVYRTSILRKIGGFQEDLFGSQDWDLAFRFIACAGEDGIIHIPKVLYHWRYLDTSTAKSIESKPYAVTAGQRAIENYCRRNGESASVLQGTWPGSFRVKQHQQKAKTVSVILPNIDQQLTEQCVDSIRRNTAYSFYEIVVLSESGESDLLDPKTGFVSGAVKYLKCANPEQSANAFNFGAKHVNGEVLIFLSPDCFIHNENWMEELVSQLEKPDVGVVGAWQQYPDQTTHSAGLILKDGVSGVMRAFEGLPESDIGHMGRAHLIQRYLAVSEKCMATKASLFDNLRGFDSESFPQAFWNVDYCLRARLDAKQYTVWNAYAKIGVRDLLEDEAEMVGELKILSEKWGSMIPIDPYFNPNLHMHDPRFFLAWPPR